ncbi:MAG: TonB-dependent receptor [Gammaproteobacteria bacterium]|nr:TonB-dependent receptor [Gammaproteobacteria bacterium]
MDTKIFFSKASAWQVKLTLSTLCLLANPGLAQNETEPKSRYNLELEEVEVTAQKRKENFMLVPITVNAFSTQDMINTGAISIQDIDSFIPGVEIGDSVGGSTQVGISIRGVSSPNISSGQDPSTATFYDGAYMPRAATSIPFTDIERIEVLKGPQGTLFGRNATSGVINIIPNKPQDEFDAFIKTRLGNQNLMRIEGMINTPLTDNTTLRTNLLSHERDGFTNNADGGNNFRDENFFAARSTLLYRFSEDTEIQLSADYEDRDEMPRPAIGVSKYAYKGSENPFRSTDQHDVIGGERESREMYGTSLKLESTLNDDWSLFALASYRAWETSNLQEEDGTANPRRYMDTNNIEDSDILYSELRLNYSDERITLVTGANYSREDVYQRTDIGLLTDTYMQFISNKLFDTFGIDLGPDGHIWDIELFGAPLPEELYLLFSSIDDIPAVLPPSFAGEYFTETMDNNGDFTNWGLFADLTYQLTDSIRLAAGLRYSYDKKEYSWQTSRQTVDWPYPLQRIQYNPTELGDGVDPNNYYNLYKATDDWNKVTGRFVVDWQFSDYAMAYFSYGTGYKSGGFDGQTFASAVSGSFDPEEMASYEIGLKGDFFNDRLRTELAVFHHQLDGRQQALSIKTGPDDLVAAPGIVSSDEKTDGIELIVTWKILENLRLGGLTTYRETDSLSELYYNTDGELSGGDNELGRTQTAYTVKLDWSPDISYGYLLLHMNYVFSENPGPDDNTPLFTTGPWYFQNKKLLNARLAWSNPSDNFEMALWGKNLLNEEHANNPGGFAADYLDVYHTIPEDTLTWGVDLRYAF